MIDSSSIKIIRSSIINLVVMINNKINNNYSVQKMFVSGEMGFESFVAWNQEESITN